MSTLTDDDLSRLLARAFEEHEHLATADRLSNAVQLSRRGVRRRPRSLVAVIAAAAILVAVAGIGWLAGRPDSRRTTFPGVSASQGLTPHATQPQLRAVTQEAVEKAVQAVRMPAGAEELPPGEQQAAAPEAVTSQSRVWSVPGTVEDVARAMADSPPPGLRSTGADLVSGDSTTIRYDDPSGAAGPVGHVVTWVAVSATDRPDEVRVLAYAEAAVRPERPASTFVDGPVDSVDVIFDRSSAGAGPRRESVTVTDHRQIEDIVAAFDGLFGVDASTPGQCGSASMAVVFHARNGDLWAEVHGGCNSISLPRAQVGLDDSAQLLGDAVTAATNGRSGTPTTLPNEVGS
jgi:hypothetical protein